MLVLFAACVFPIEPTKSRSVEAAAEIHMKVVRLNDWEVYWRWQRLGKPEMFFNARKPFDYLVNLIRAVRHAQSITAKQNWPTFAICWPTQTILG